MRNITRNDRDRWSAMMMWDDKACLQGGAYEFQDESAKRATKSSKFQGIHQAGAHKNSRHQRMHTMTTTRPASSTYFRTHWILDASCSSHERINITWKKEFNHTLTATRPATSASSPALSSPDASCSPHCTVSILSTMLSKVIPTDVLIVSLKPLQIIGEPGHLPVTFLLSRSVVCLTSLPPVACNNRVNYIYVLSQGQMYIMPHCPLLSASNIKLQCMPFPPQGLLHVMPHFPQQLWSNLLSHHPGSIARATSSRVRAPFHGPRLCCLEL